MSPLAHRHQILSLPEAETMGDYNSYLDGLMADCRRSVQHHFDPPQSPHVAPQYFATRPSPLPSHTFKEPKATVPRPHISKNLPGTAIAPVAHTLGSVPFATTAPGPYTHNYLNLPAAGPGPGPPRSPPPAATTPSPFTPLFELPIASSISACAPQKSNAPTTPVRLTEQRHDRRKDCIEEEADKEYPPRYKNMSQGPMRKELKRRGLLCHGPNADLFKRLKKDDKFQGKPRTAENYDTMNPKDIHMLCVHRCIPSHGSVTSLRDRLKAHDKRDKMMEAAVSGLRPVVVYCSGHLPTLEVKPDREMVEEKPLVPITKDEPASVTEIAGIVEETFEPVESAKALDYAETGLINGMLLYHNRRKACSTCRQRKVSSMSKIYLDLADSCYSVVVYIMKKAMRTL